eukprot:1155857-Pelagomonas_calceolata.AAC.2
MYPSACLRATILLYYPNEGFEAKMRQVRAEPPDKADCPKALTRIMQKKRKDYASQFQLCALRKGTLKRV